MDIQLSKFTMKPAASPTQRRTNAIFEIVLLVVIAGLFYWFVARPKQAQLSLVQDNIVSLQQERDSLDSNKQKLQHLIAQLDANKTEITDMDEALPLSSKSVRLRILIDTLARSSGLTVTALNVSMNSDTAVSGDKALLADPYRGTRTVQKLTSTLAVTGTYGQVEDFLNKIGTNGRVVDINTIDIHSSKDNTLVFNITMDTYYYGL